MTTTDQILRVIPLLCQHAMATGRQIAEANKLVEKALMRALLNIDSLTPHDYVEPWLFSFLDEEIALADGPHVGQMQ